MTTITDTFTFAGSSLDTYAYNIQMLGVLEQLPPKRGENLVIPGRAGRTYVPKKFDQNQITLSMVIRDQVVGGGSPSQTQLLANLDAIKQLFGKLGQQDLQYTNASETRSATVEVVDVIEFQRTSQTSYALVVTMIMAEPYWTVLAGEELATFVLATDALGNEGITVSETGIDAVPHDFTVNNTGTAPVESALISIGGVITDPQITIVDYYVKYTGTVANTKTLTINCDTFTASYDGSDVTSLITHGGDVVWLPIPTGSNEARLTGSGPSSASVTISFTKQYF